VLQLPHHCQSCSSFGESHLELLLNSGKPSGEIRSAFFVGIHFVSFASIWQVKAIAGNFSFVSAGKLAEKQDGSIMSSTDLHQGRWHCREKPWSERLGS